MKVLTHKRDAEVRKQSLDSWKIADQDKEDIKLFLEAYERGEITGRVGTNLPATIERTLEYLKPAFIYINKKTSVHSIKKKDKEIVQDFLSALLKDKIKSKLEKPYSLKVKKLMLKTLVNYFEWRLPEDCFPIVKIINIRIDSKLPEPDYLTEEEVLKLYKHTSKSYQRYMIAVLFSGGLRAEEFVNLKYSDIELPKDRDVFIRLRIQNPTSKTKGRTISLYWKYCLEAVKEYLDERINDGMKPDDFVFNVGYDTARYWLGIAGKRILGKNVHFHLFRSSCATWMCDKLPTKTEYCYFFGWNFSSPMPDIYISRKGINLKPVDDKFQKTELEEIKTKLEQDSQKKDIKIEEQDKKISEMKKILQFFADYTGVTIKKDTETGELEFLT